VKPRSLRARLALWHAGLLAVTLVALASTTLWLLRGFLTSRADAGLQAYAEAVAATIATDLYRASVERAGAPRDLLRREMQEWGRQVQVVDAETGLPVAWTDGLASQKLPLTLEARVRALSGRRMADRVTFETRTDLGERPVRIVTVPVIQGERVPYLVQAAVSLEGIEGALQRTATALLVLVPCVFVLSLLGGWVLVGRSLRTVDTLTRTAMAIRPENLDQRVEPPGSDDEIARLASAFNEMITRLDQSFRQIQRFSADASHELRTPLTTLRGEAEVALMGARTTEDYRRALQSIVEEADRMNKIVDQLLLLARADANSIPMHIERLTLPEVALEGYEAIEPAARARGVNVELGEMEDVEVQGDRFWLGQIAVNLLNNAVKYTPAGGTVWLEVRLADSAAELVVRDSGPGIAPEHLPHIFDRFYRTDTGRSRDAGGVGLGLSIARWAARAQGGDIVAESTPGEGSVFRLRLPLAVDRESREEAHRTGAAS
jgi:heavy metal sensor kinase